MKLNEDNLKELQAILVVSILTILIAVTLYGCTPPALIGVEKAFRAKAEFCQTMAHNLEIYRNCMDEQSSPD